MGDRAKRSSHLSRAESVLAARVDLGGSRFDVITEANTFPSIQCGLCVVLIIGLQDVKCRPRTEPGKGWAECLFREPLPTTEESRVRLPRRLNNRVLFREQR